MSASWQASCVHTMTDHRQGAGRYAEQQFSSKPPRIPRLTEYQRRGQLPMTLLALIVILTACFAYWILTL